MTFQPTKVGDTPAVCNCCGRHAIGIGIGDGKEPRYLCQECVILIEQLKRVRRFDPYELEARMGGMEAAGPLVDEFGSDLAEWSEEQVLIFCAAIWKGCADKLREVIRKGEAPF
ncbi:hypothetical protein SAMN03159496_04655 [Rhizobium sp. NFR07]|uniref:DUF6511 domain-containing protein n=1 Tax=Rhizobium sp. NFR07 TaxID=1566262 RepID=UPI0008EF43B0|nr:DUF6511 domain-containing protein [Rhizobium sp. NFR07]SFB52490.1 hypothetical protein SAMN03159496_04655 [Rhizobium sp. NFR07]